jgi:sterol desaturase/sphingolipid hydroxylase (fatty acid hydroxylase superfamily)
MADAESPAAVYAVSRVAEAIGRVPSALTSHAAFLAEPHGVWPDAMTLVLPWAVHFVFSWLGFLLYMVWDYNAYRAGKLKALKLPTRHPVDAAPAEAMSPGVDPVSPTPAHWPILFGIRMPPFWYSQLFMCPLVLFNQLVVWPLVSLLVVWPQWARNYRPLADWTWAELLPTMVVLFLISDVMWYWSHRLMHVPWCWKHLHRMHHVAPQCAISATYVHPWEYTLWVIAMQLPWAIAGFPLDIFLIPLAWGMLTGSGAHSGYGDTFANGAKHNAHHYFHNVNFSLLMLADMVWGTHWSPGDKPPSHNRLQDEIEAEYPRVFQGDLEKDLGEVAAGGKTKAA